jgi:predicted RNA-binding protein YlxR (DUF448 family)
MTSPVRTCIGCRRPDAAAELVRLTLADGRVVIAGPGRTGRGASVHPRPACLEIGLRPEVLARAFKRRVTIQDAAELLQQVTKRVGTQAAVPPESHRGSPGHFEGPGGKRRGL